MTRASLRLLGIDIGTTALKVALFDGAGNQLAISRIPCPSEGEFDPGKWIAAAREAVSGLATDRLDAVGICGRGGTNVFLGADGAVVAPSWGDHRAADEYRELAARPDLSPQSRALLAKALWWQRNRGPVTTAFSAKDLLVFDVTGEVVSDPSSGGCDDTAAPLVLACKPWARAGTTLAGSWLPPGVPVAAGWHDGAAATFGAGAADAGCAPITLGTTAVYRVVARELPANLRKYWDLTPSLTVTGGDILGAGRAVAWAAELLPGASAEASIPGANGVSFLPQMQGRIAPVRRPDARGGWYGLEPEATKDDLFRAVLEGVAFSLRQVGDWLRDAGLSASGTVATGGGARKPLQVQILSDVLQEEIGVAACEEGCRGAALLGAVAAGLFTLEEARTMQPPMTIYRPHPEHAAAYETAYARFLRVQQALDAVPESP